MTKAELVEEVSRVSDLTKKHSELIVDTVFTSIIDALQRGEKIELRGFGSFRLRQREPRKGRNPKTGDKVDVPPKKVPEKFDAEKAKEILRTGSSAHPEQAVFTNEAYRWDIDHRIGDRYFELNGACVDYSQMQYQFVDASFCKK